MDIYIFAIGFLVCMTVIYGIFSLVPMELAKSEDVDRD